VLVTEAPILILDEPFTGGLDPAAILALGRVLKHLAEREDMTVLMASQIAEMVEPLAHRIAILEGTQVKAYDTLDGLRAKTGCSGSLPEVFENLVWTPGESPRISRETNGARSTRARKGQSKTVGYGHANPHRYPKQQFRRSICETRLAVPAAFS
jgi:ABC-type multidrug transport system ATPase subunit